MSSLAFILTCMAATIPETSPSNHSFETNDANIDPLLEYLDIREIFQINPFRYPKTGISAHSFHPSDRSG